MLHDFLHQAELLKDENTNILHSKQKPVNIIAKYLIGNEINRLLKFIKKYPTDQISYKDIIDCAKFIYSTEDSMNDIAEQLANFDIYGYRVSILNTKCSIRIKYKKDPSAWISVTTDLNSNIIITENEYTPISGYRRESVDKITELLISEIFIRFIHGYLTVYLDYLE